MAIQTPAPSQAISQVKSCSLLFRRLRVLESGAQFDGTRGVTPFAVLGRIAG